MTFTSVYIFVASTSYIPVSSYYQIISRGALQKLVLLVNYYSGTDTVLYSSQQSASNYSNVETGCIKGVGYLR